MGINKMTAKDLSAFGRLGNHPDIANTVPCLCSDMAGFITGENICIDGGMTKQMIYHGDCGRSSDTKN